MNTQESLTAQIYCLLKSLRNGMGVFFCYALQIGRLTMPKEQPG